MKSINNQKGFTLIELIMVITILAILAISAAPSFLDLTSQAATVTVDGIRGSVQDGVNMAYGSNAANGNPAFPTDAEIDTNTVGDPCTICFDGVLQQPLNDARWTKDDADSWTFASGSVSITCDYDDTTGVISCA